MAIQGPLPLDPREGKGPAAGWGAAVGSWGLAGGLRKCEWQGQWLLEPAGRPWKSKSGAAVGTLTTDILWAHSPAQRPALQRSRR